MDGLKFIKKVSSILTKNPPICLCLPTLVAKHFEAIIYIYNSALFLDRRFKNISISEPFQFR